jgi:hypothetical protein
VLLVSLHACVLLTYFTVGIIEYSDLDFFPKKTEKAQAKVNSENQNLVEFDVRVSKNT